MQIFSTRSSLRRERGRGSQRVVGLELDHRPDHDPHRGQRVFQRMKLRPQGAVDAFARLVALPEVVAEGLDDVVGRDADVRGAAFEHLRDRVEDAGDRPERGIPFLRPPDPVELAEELVGPVDEVDDLSMDMGWKKIPEAVDFGQPRSSHG